jgi:hypothetical protein
LPGYDCHMRAMARFSSVTHHGMISGYPMIMIMSSVTSRICALSELSSVFQLCRSLKVHPRGPESPTAGRGLSCAASTGFRGPASSYHDAGRQCQCRVRTEARYLRSTYHRKTSLNLKLVWVVQPYHVSVSNSDRDKMTPTPRRSEEPRSAARARRHGGLSLPGPARRKIWPGSRFKPRSSRPGEVIRQRRASRASGFKLFRASTENNILTLRKGLRFGWIMPDRLATATVTVLRLRLCPRRYDHRLSLDRFSAWSCVLESSSNVQTA